MEESVRLQLAGITRANRLMIGPEMLQEMENMVRKVQQNLKEAQDRQKSYADQKRKTLGISSRRPCLFEGQSLKELVEVRELCEDGTQVLWALRDTSSNWTRSIPTCTPS
jgi:hypothetical protein